MHVDIFETTDSRELAKLKTLCAREGKDISIEKIYTAGVGSGSGYYHYVTVTYFTLTDGAKVL